MVPISKWTFKLGPQMSIYAIQEQTFVPLALPRNCLCSAKTLFYSDSCLKNTPRRIPLYLFPPCQQSIGSWFVLSFVDQELKSKIESYPRNQFFNEEIKRQSSDYYFHFIIRHESIFSKQDCESSEISKLQRMPFRLRTSTLSSNANKWRCFCPVTAKLIAKSIRWRHT